MISTSLTFSLLLIVFLQGCNTGARSSASLSRLAGTGLQAGGDESRALDDECDPAALFSPEYEEESRCKSSPPGEMLMGRLQAHKSLNPLYPVAMVEQGAKLPAGVGNAG